MEPTFEVKKINLGIKELMRRKGKKYHELAEFLDLSVSSVKRLLNSGQMSVDRLGEVALFLDTTLFALLAFAEGEVKREDTTLTLAQEEFLADNPQTFAYLGQLMHGMSVKEVEETFKLSKKKSRRILKSLEKWGLLEIWPEDRVKFLLPPGFIVFRRNGPVNKAYYWMRFNCIQDNMRAKAPPEPGGDPVELGHYLKMLSFGVSKETYDEILRDFKRLVEEKANRGIREASLLAKDEIKQITIACYIDEYDMWKPVNDLIMEG